MRPTKEDIMWKKKEDIMWNKIGDLLAVIFVVALCQVSLAQYSSGIEGIIQDKSGALVAGARVEIKNLATGVVTSTTSSNVGIFRFPGLPYGNYSLEAERAGFQKVIRPQLEVPSNRIVVVNLVMELGAIIQSVTINEGVADVDLAQTRVSTVLSEEAVRTMPLPGRNAFVLSALVPGVGGPAASTFSTQSLEPRIISPTKTCTPCMPPATGWRITSTCWTTRSRTPPRGPAPTPSAPVRKSSRRCG
jgi:hypothetical protein